MFKIFQQDILLVGKVSKVNIVNLATYKNCKNIANSILNYPNFTALECVLVPNSLFIDTGVCEEDANITIATSFTGFSVLNGYSAMFIWGHGGQPGVCDLVAMPQSSCWGIMSGGTGIPFAQVPYVDNKRFEVISMFNSTTYTIAFNWDGNVTPVIVNGTYPNITGISNILLYGGMTGGIPFWYFGTSNYVQIYKNNSLVRDFIPVLNTTNIPCLYDKVTREYYYSQGATFNPGPNKEDA